MRASRTEYGRPARSSILFARWFARVCLGSLILLISPVVYGQDRFFDDWFHAFDEPAIPSTEDSAPPNQGNVLIENRGASSSIPDSERPTPRSPDLQDAAHPVDLGPSKTELQELSQWVRWFAIRNLPPNIEDNRKWGKQRKVYDGVDLHWDGERLDTKRRWKMVDHGTWSRYFIEWIDPAKRLEIRVLRLDSWKNGRGFTSSVRMVAPLKVFARVSQFQRGVQLISVSMQADATVAMEIDLEVETRFNPLVFPPDVEFRPKASRADVQLLEFEMHRISQIQGDVAEWLGKGVRGILDRKISDANDKLVLKINDSLTKQQDRLRISAQEWIQSSFCRLSSSKAAENKDAAKSAE